MESYWEKAARGAAPQNGGWTSLVNPLAYGGNPIDMNALVDPSKSGATTPGNWTPATAPQWWKDQQNQQLTDRNKKSLQDTVFKQARDAQLAQQAAVKSRLDEQILGYKERRSTAAKSMAGASKNATDEINRNFDGLISKTRNQLNNSGLGQTTMTPTTISGIERDRAAALRDATSKSAMDASGVDSQLSGDYLQFLGGIEDEFNPDALAATAQAAGAATQNQLDNSAFGGDFFGGGMGGMGGGIGGSAYGGAAGGWGFGEGGGYGQPQQNGWTDPFGVGVQQQQSGQKRAGMSLANQNRMAAYERMRAAKKKPAYYPSKAGPAAPVYGQYGVNHGAPGDGGWNGHGFAEMPDHVVPREFMNNPDYQEPGQRW